MYPLARGVLVSIGAPSHSGRDPHTRCPPSPPPRAYCHGATSLLPTVCICRTRWTDLCRCVASGAKIILSKLPVGDLATQFFADRNLFCAGRVAQDDMERVAKVREEGSEYGGEECLRLLEEEELIVNNTDSLLVQQQ